MNPIYKKEMRMMARSRQLSTLVVVFNLILTVAVAIALYVITVHAEQTGSSPYKYMMYFYVMLVSMEIGLLCLCIPSLVAGSIAGERERQTLDILLSSRLEIKDIVGGKLFSCISMALLLLVSSLPMLAVCLMYGGIHFADIYKSVAYAGFFVVLMGSIGIFCSCRLKTTTHACILAYSILLMLTVGTGFLVIGVMSGVNTYQVTETFSFFRYFLSMKWLVYVWLCNPAVTYAVIMCSQMGYSTDFLESLVFYGASESVVTYWVVLSIGVQCVFITVLLVLSVKYLNPLNEKIKKKKMKF